MDSSIKSTNDNQRAIEKLKEIPTSTLSDVLDSLGINGVITGITPISEGITLIGTALPVKAICGPRGSYSFEDFAIGSVIDIATKGNVIVIEFEGEPVSTWGGLASKAALNKGIAGIVVNGGVRDIDEIRQLKFPVFAKHRVPISGKTRLKHLAIDETIECCNIRVQSGDIIVGDSTGLIVIPSDRATEILHKAKELEKLDRIFEKELNKGGTFQKTAKNLRHL